MAAVSSFFEFAFLFLLASVFFGSSFGQCQYQLNGTYWNDNEGTLNIMLQNGSSLEAIALLPTTWSSANGTMNGFVITMSFSDSTSALTGTLSQDCTSISWSNNAEWFLDHPPLFVTKVHLVYMTHLDVGFTNLARNVCDTYFYQHFPHALATAADLRAMGGPETFAYTTHPWLVTEYLDGAVNCSNFQRTPEEVQIFEDAILNGDVRWQGKPMNIFPELADEGLNAFGLTLAQGLNEQFGTSWGSVTAKSTDVPGLSRSMIPILARAGLQAVHMGYNLACVLADVPPVFVWQHPETGTEIIAMVESGYGNQVVVDGFSEALVFCYTMDNGPPPTADEVVAFWELLRLRFPNAAIEVSSLDAFGLALASIKDTLPVVTSEIGDTWLYGAPADPFKLATFREIRRSITSLIDEGLLDASNPQLAAYNRRLLNVPEHNWGLSVGQYLPALRTTTGNWSNPLFHEVEDRPDYAFLASGWAEKRTFLYPLNGTQEEAEFADLVMSRVRDLTPRHPRAAYPTLVQLESLSSSQCPYFNITFDPFDGSIIGLQDTSTGRQWASTSNPLALLRYNTFTEADFNNFNEQYNPNCGPPCGDFAKQGMDSGDPVYGIYTPSLVSVSSPEGLPCTFLVELSMSPSLVASYGAAASYWMNVTLGSSLVDVQISWFNKTSTRLAEATWVSFSPIVGNPSNWILDVLNETVNPLDVVANGSRHLHAVWSGVYFQDVSTSLFIETWDAPLVSLDEDITHILDFDGNNLPTITGAHFNIHNNLWGTAFPQWYSDDASFRFTLDFAYSGPFLSKIEAHKQPKFK